MLRQPMYIYISGPYSPPASETDLTKSNQIIEENIRRANEIALAIFRKGHIPFVPHTMMSGWDDVYNVPRERALYLCHKWVEKCDALYFIASSEGADSELEVAVSLGKMVYRSLDEIPEADL